jgi:hypothetical protein
LFDRFSFTCFVDLSTLSTCLDWGTNLWSSSFNLLFSCLFYFIWVGSVVYLISFIWYLSHNFLHIECLSAHLPAISSAFTCLAISPTANHKAWVRVKCYLFGTYIVFFCCFVYILDQSIAYCYGTDPPIIIYFCILLFVDLLFSFFVLSTYLTIFHSFCASIYYSGIHCPVGGFNPYFEEFRHEILGVI